MRGVTPNVNLVLGAASLVATLSLVVTPAEAQSIIKNPGDHPDYSVELEPHGLLMWGHHNFGDAGWGLGMHAVIPFLDNGPISKINNNMGIGFGLDWAHFDEDGCWWGWGGPRFANPYWDCSGNSFLFPVYLQWNFFLTPIISVFGEPGFGIVHDTWDADPCPLAGGCDASDTDPILYFEGGARFLFGETVGLTVRIGYPMLTVGVSFLL
jgi:hypothetical protein